MKIRDIILESTQSLNVLDDPQYYKKCLDTWTSYYDNRGESELEEYKYRVDDLIKNGGKVYRVIFADSPEEIRLTDLGHHWTTESYNIDEYLDNLWSNYGSGKKNAYVVVANVGSNNITNKDVDVSGNPEEKEVNIINPNQAKYEVYQYKDKQFSQRVRESINLTKKT